MSDSQYSFHADRWSSPLFASLWVNAWGAQYPVKVAPFSSCTLRLLEQLDRYVDLNPSEVLVDVGCGTGGAGLWLAQNKKARLVGIDRCPDAVSIATSRVHEWKLVEPATFTTADFCDTGLEPGIADAAISIDAFTATHNILSALAEIHRILKPRGVFVFTARETSPSSRHYKNLDGSWHAGLEKIGFYIENILERSEVSKLWLDIFAQWLKHESNLRIELQDVTVDALVNEAHREIPKMNIELPWYLIKAVKSN